MGKGIKTGLAILWVVIGIVSLLWFIPTAPTGASGVVGGERRPVLSPNLFKGKTAYTYQIAKAIPEVLDNIYCYCHCQKHSGHKSLLSCYTDKHAAFCDICQDEAVVAYELYKEGKDIQTIKKAIDKGFAR